MTALKQDGIWLAGNSSFFCKINNLHAVRLLILQNTHLYASAVSSISTHPDSLLLARGRRATVRRYTGCLKTFPPLAISIYVACQIPRFISPFSKQFVSRREITCFAKENNLFSRAKQLDLETTPKSPAKEQRPYHYHPNAETCY